MCLSVLQGVAVRCSVLHRVTSPDSPSLFWRFLALTAACCNGLQRVTVCCSVLEILSADGQVDGYSQRRRPSGHMPTMCRSVLQCVAVCCSVLQCVAVCCSVLHCVVLCFRVLCELECVVSVLLCVPVVCCRWRCRVGT